MDIQVGLCILKACYTMTAALMVDIERHKDMTRTVITKNRNGANEDGRIIITDGNIAIGRTAWVGGEVSIACRNLLFLETAFVLLIGQIMSYFRSDGLAMRIYKCDVWARRLKLYVNLHMMF